MAVPDDERVRAHNVRVPHARWVAFGRRVKLLSHTRTGVLNQFIAWYCREPGARLPQRPGSDADDPSS